MNNDPVSKKRDEIFAHIFGSDEKEQDSKDDNIEQENKELKYDGHNEIADPDPYSKHAFDIVDSLIEHLEVNKKYLTKDHNLRENFIKEKELTPEQKSAVECQAEPKTNQQIKKDDFAGKFTHYLDLVPHSVCILDHVGTWYPITVWLEKEKTIMTYLKNGLEGTDKHGNVSMLLNLPDEIIEIYAIRFYDYKNNYIEYDVIPKKYSVIMENVH